MFDELRWWWSKRKRKKARQKMYPQAREVLTEIGRSYTDVLPETVSLNKERAMDVIADALVEGGTPKAVAVEFRALVGRSPAYYLDGWSEYLNPLVKKCKDLASERTISNRKLDFKEFDKFERTAAPEGKRKIIDSYAVFDSEIVSRWALERLLLGTPAQELYSRVLAEVDDRPEVFFTIRPPQVSSKGALGYDRLNVRPNRPNQSQSSR